MHTTFYECPNTYCTQPATVSWSTELTSTDGPVETAKTMCTKRHVFVLPTEYLHPVHSI